MKVDFWKVIRLICSVLLTAFLLFSISERLSAPLDGITIRILQSNDGKKLITEKEVRTLLKYELGYDISIAEIKELNLNGLEKMLDRNTRVDNAELYLDKNNVLHVRIEQKTPIVRINVTSAEDYYLDYKGSRVPVTETFRVPVVTGNVDAYSDSYITSAKNNLNSVLQIARKLYDDAFLNALVEQIYIDENNEITLVPKLGRDKILLGDVNDLDEKIYKLKTYYEKGIKNIGLEKFDELDLKYKGQIIGRQKDT